MIDAIKLKVNTLKNTYLPAGSLRARFVKGAFWSFVGAVIARGLNLISSIIVARLLGTVGYGELGIIQSTVGMFGVFAGLGLGMTATKYVAEFREKDPQKAGRIIALASIMAFISGGIVSIILVILSPWLASRTLSAPHLTGLLQLGSGLLFFGAINGAQTGALAGFEAFKTIATVNFLSGIISFPLMVAGVWFFQLKGAVLALVGSMVVNYFLNRIAIKKECERYNIRPDFQNSIQEIAVVWKFSIPAFLSSAMVGPVTWLCNTMLVNQPNGYAEMGIFNAALVFQNLLIFVGSTVGNPLLSIITNEITARNPKLEKINMISTWALGVAATFFLLNLSSFVQLLYGAEFSSKSFLYSFILIIISASVVLYKQGFARVLIANGMMGWSLLSNTFWALILVIFTSYFVRWGAVGLATAYILAYTINTIVFIPLYTKRKLVPSKTIASVEALIIWGWLVFFAILAWTNVALSIRFLCLPFGFYAIYRIYRSLMNTSNRCNA